MFTIIVHKLDAAGRALAFSHAHPADDSGHVAAVARLESLLSRAWALARLEYAAHMTVASAVELKAQQRRMIRDDLHLIICVARAAAHEAPDLPIRFVLPSLRSSQLAFVTDARTLLGIALPRVEVLRKYGLPADLLDELSGTLDRHEATIDRKAGGQSDHVGASAGLQHVTDEIMDLLRLLDALNCRRFRGDTGLLTAWKSAHAVVWPHRERRRQHSTDATAGESQSP